MFTPEVVSKLRIYCLSGWNSKPDSNHSSWFGFSLPPCYWSPCISGVCRCDLVQSERPDPNPILDPSTPPNPVPAVKKRRAAPTLSVCFKWCSWFCSDWPTRLFLHDSPLCPGCQGRGLPLLCRFHPSGDVWHQGGLKWNVPLIVSEWDTRHLRP